MKTETWLGHKIRFVEKSGEWWAVLQDIAEALDLRTFHIKERLAKDVVSTDTLLTAGGPQEMLVVNEYGIYETVFESRKPEAKEFKRWVFEMLRALRAASGLEGFQIFHMLDKEHQREAMARLNAALDKPVLVDFIKANVIANKAVSTRYGCAKMLKKGDMTPDMLVERQAILDSTVELMSINACYGLELCVSDTVYKRFEASKPA